MALGSSGKEGNPTRYNESMLVLAVRVLVKAGAEEQVAEYFRQLTVQSRKESGCILYIVNQSIANPRSFMVYEQYEDEAALTAHRESAHFKKYAEKGLYTLTESREADLFNILS